MFPGFQRGVPAVRTRAGQGERLKGSALRRTEGDTEAWVRGRSIQSGDPSCAPAPGAAGVVGGGGAHTEWRRLRSRGVAGVRGGGRGGGQMRLGSMLAGNMLSPASPLQRKGCWVLSKAKCTGGATGTGLLLFLSGSFLQKPRLMTQKLAKKAAKHS